METIDLYQIHAWDPLTRLEETLRFLDDAVRAGKINYVGLSNFTGWQLQKAVDIAEFRGLSVPVSMQPQYNLLARQPARSNGRSRPPARPPGSACSPGPRWPASG